MSDIVTDIADRLKTMIPGFTDEIAKDFEAKRLPLLQALQIA